MKSRNKVFRLLSLILVTAFLVAVLAACGGSTTTTTTQGTTTTAAPGQTTTEGTTGGSDEVVEYSIMIPLYTELPDEESDVYQKLTELTGVKWNATWVSSSDYATKFQAVMASDDLPDVIVPTNLLDISLNQGIQNGYFHDLTDILGDFSNYPNLKNNTVPSAFNFVSTPEGRIMAIPRQRARIEMTIFMRKDWMDQAGVEIPKDVWEWKDALKAIVEMDPVGGGNTLGYAAHPFVMGGGYIDDNMSSAFGAYNGQQDEDGGLYYYQLNDGHLEYVDFVKELYDEGLISEEFSVMKLSDTEEMFRSGLAASYTRTGTYAWSYQEALKNIDPEAEVIPLPAMKGTGDDTTAVVTAGVFGAFYINSNVEQDRLERLVQYFEDTCTEEFHNLAFFGIEGTHYEIAADGSKQMTEVGNSRAMDYKSIQQLATLIDNVEMKLMNATAPQEYNDMVIETASNYNELGKLNRFRVLSSNSWPATWAKYQQNFEENTILYIQGQMSQDEYHTYVKDLRSQDDMKVCFQEFAAHDAVLFPDGY